MQVTDESLAKFAEENQVEPLAHQWGVKLADAEGLLAQVTLESFHEKLASLGWGAGDQKQAAELEDIAELLLKKEASEATDDGGYYKFAADTLRQQLGDPAPSSADAAEAQNARDLVIQRAYTKAAALASNPDVARHLTARYEAHQILSQQQR